MLEMFNTLLRQLRLSIDYALTGSYDVAMSLGTKIIKEHEERMFQEAVIKTIGGTGGGALWAGPGGGRGLRCRVSPGWAGQGAASTAAGTTTPRRSKRVVGSNCVPRGRRRRWNQSPAPTALGLA